MPKYTFFLLFVISITLAACQGQSLANPTMTAPAADVPATATQVQTALTATDDAQQAVLGAPPGCTVTSPLPTAGPTEPSVFPPVTDKDWSTGPKDATATLIEYSDFQ
jgi:hypothetical protein